MLGFHQPDGFRDTIQLVAQITRDRSTEFAEHQERWLILNTVSSDPKNQRHNRLTRENSL